MHSYWTFRFLHDHAPISGQITWILCHLNSSTMCSLLLFVLVSSHVLFYVFLHLFYPVFCESCSSFMYPIYHVCSFQNSLNISICCFIVFGVYDFIILPKHESLCYLSSFRVLNSSNRGYQGYVAKSVMKCLQGLYIIIKTTISTTFLFSVHAVMGPVEDNHSILDNLLPN